MTLETRIKLLSTDVLGTLIHIPTEHDSGALSLDDLVDTGESRRTVHKQTQQRLGQLQQMGITVVLVSGMRSRSYERIGPHLPHDYAAIEDGSLLFKGDERDKDWDQKLAQELVVLQTYKDQLRRKGLTVDDDGRGASFRIDPERNEYPNLRVLTIAYPELDNFPQQLKRTEHTPYPPSHACYQFVPASGGKANALEFIMQRSSLSWANVAAFGDDLNDKEMMEKASVPMTLAGSNGAIQKLVIDKGGIIVPGYSHNGSILALTELIKMISPQPTG